MFWGTIWRFMPPFIILGMRSDLLMGVDHNQHHRCSLDAHDKYVVLHQLVHWVKNIHHLSTDNIISCFFPRPSHHGLHLHQGSPFFFPLLKINYYLLNIPILKGNSEVYLSQKDSSVKYLIECWKNVLSLSSLKF